MPHLAAAAVAIENLRRSATHTIIALHNMQLFDCCCFEKGPDKNLPDSVSLTPNRKICNILSIDQNYAE